MEYPDEGALNIYTDGSCLPKPRRGGLAGLFILINDDGVEEDYPLPPLGYGGATNNQMELEACIEALRLATSQHPPFERSRYRKVVIHTDSEYVASNYQTALFTWSTNGWLKRSGAPVDNAPQWKQLVQLLRRSHRQARPVTIKWVPGKRSPRTKAVDKAAKTAAKGTPPRQLVPSQLRRKRTGRPIEPGSVRMLGQMMTINVFKTEYQRLHRLLKCWYTVESRKSPYRGRADLIYADPALPLRRGHTFRIRVNEDSGNPRILKVFKEVD